jgi:hypothetical protein
MTTPKTTPDEAPHEVPQEAALPSHVGDSLVVHRRATDETGEEIGHGSVAHLTRREATDETGETIGGGSTGTESWAPVEPPPTIP